MSRGIGRVRVGIFFICAGLFGCGRPRVELLTPRGDGDAATDAGEPESLPLPGLQSLRLEPSSLIITDDGVAPPEAANVRAWGTFASGERDVTGEVGWSLSDSTLGTVQGGVVTSATVGGTTQVVARAEGITASADVTFLLDITLVAERAPDAIEAMFPADEANDVVGDTASLRVVYPNNETMFPRNLERVLHQWQAAPNLDAFELSYRSEFATIRVYTDRRSHSTEGSLWGFLSKTHAGRSLTFHVRGTSASSGGVIHRSRDTTLYYSKSEVRGALYYWSTGAQGVMRATIGAGNAARFFPGKESGDVTCAACHTVSRDGRRLAVGYGGERLRQVSIPEAKLEIPAAPAQEGPAYGWGTFNPSATRLLYASKGKLTLLNAENGAALGNIRLPGGMVATYPDWSPDGKWVVVSVGFGKMGNKDVTSTSLARIAVLPNDQFGEPEIIRESAVLGDTLCFAMFAPDSQTLAFVRAVGKSKDNPTSQLFLLPADGSAEPQPLQRLNRRTGHAEGALNIFGNTMPTWAPSTTKDVYWLAFSSVRDYGDVLVGQARDQIWGAAIDPAKIGTSDDPSYASFWMPFQQIEEHNHRAFWAVDPRQACPPSIEICDNLDNDCDGVPDNDCCTPKPEICGNQRDEDCDGTNDDGCTCASTEDCDNKVDDDCDGLSDANDEDCAPIVQ